MFGSIFLRFFSLLEFFFIELICLFQSYTARLHFVKLEVFC